jgi:SulP family sulfate permease
MVRWLRPEPGTLRDDAIAGIPGAVSSVPDGTASPVLVGVNPVYGPYTSFAGPIAGGPSAGTRMRVITTTSAAALAAGSAVSGFDGVDRKSALFTLT